MINRIIRQWLMAKHPDYEWIHPLHDSLVEFLTIKGLKIGGRYRHFKGNEYIVDELDSDDVVHYHSVLDGKEWHRPRSEFLEDIERDGYKGPRFTLIG